MEGSKCMIQAFLGSISWRRPLQDTNLKDAVCAMVERLDDGVKRMELASETQNGPESEQLRHSAAFKVE